jgi:hypothetical protein
VVDLRDTKHITWDRFLGFVGQRGSDDGHCAIALSDGSTVRFSAVLNAGDGDFYNAEDGLSLVDELNRLAERAQGRERPSSEPPAISIERIVLATAPRLLLDLEEDAMLGDEIEGADLAASIVFREPVVGVPVDIAMGEEPFFAEPPAERVGPEPIPVPEPIHVEEPIHVQEPVFIQEPVYSAELIDISEPIDLSERIDVSEPAELPEPAIVVPEPVFTQSATTPRLHSRVLQELSAEVVASATAMPQADGTSPGARRLAAFLETQKPNEPLPAPVRRSLLAGLGRRRAERRERDSVTGAG